MVMDTILRKLELGVKVTEYVDILLILLLGIPSIVTGEILEGPLEKNELI